MVRSTSFDFALENNREFYAAIDKYAESISDFSIPFRIIASSWFRNNKRLFMLGGDPNRTSDKQSTGRYQKLAPAAGKEGNPTTTSNYRDQKEAKYGRLPIMVVSGKLRTAATGGTGSHLVIRRRTLEMGIVDKSVPYAKYHNSDLERRTLPQRKVVFISGGEKDKAKDSRTGGDIARFKAIVLKYVEKNGTRFKVF